MCVYVCTFLSGQLMGKKKLMKRALAEEACDVSRKRARHEKQSEGMSSSDEAEFEKMPRPSTWELKAEKKGVRYLLPLKATHGKLILQEPTGLEGQSLKSQWFVLTACFRWEF